eukprot:12917963-Alexandrium_andersonii.AAC.1
MAPAAAAALCAGAQFVAVGGARGGHGLVRWLRPSAHGDSRGRELRATIRRCVPSLEGLSLIHISEPTRLALI